MRCKISRRVFEASGLDEDNVNVTLNWVLGYFSSKNKYISLICHIVDAHDEQAEVEIEDSIISKLDAKFGGHADSLVSTLLAIAYGLGGAE